MELQTTAGENLQGHIGNWVEEWVDVDLCYYQKSYGVFLLDAFEDRRSKYLKLE